MPNQRNDYFLRPVDDPNRIEFYVKKLMDCNDALIAMYERHECFLEAHYNARNKDMLAIYSMLDTMTALIADMKKEQIFRQTTADGVRALVEILPEIKPEFDKGSIFE